MQARRGVRRGRGSDYFCEIQQDHSLCSEGRKLSCYLLQSIFYAHHFFPQSGAQLFSIFHMLGKYSLRKRGIKLEGKGKRGG